MTRIVALVLALLAAPAHAQDMLDLHAVAMPQSPPVADWPQTIRITRVDLDPRGGVALTFDRVVPDRWKVFTNPLVPDENFQFTVWACVQRTYCAGFVQMWQGRSMTDGSLPPILSTGAANWWRDVRHLWGAMSDYQPQPGDEIGFLVTAGNARLTFGVSSVAERSNVVVVSLPAGDSGHFAFTGESPPPVVTPPVSPPPVVTPPVVTPLPEGVLLELRALRQTVDELARATGDAHASIHAAVLLTDADVNAGREENRAAWRVVADHWKSITMVAGPVVTWWTTQHFTGTKP